MSIPRPGVARLTETNLQIDPDEERELATAQTGITGTGNWSVSFANVDDRLVPVGR